MIPPFVSLNGHAHLVLNFQLDHPDVPLPLADLLPELDHRRDQAGLLLLRPLSRREALLLCRYRDEAEIEAWAKIRSPRAEGRRRSKRR
jgi:hypothetical protein